MRKGQPVLLSITGKLVGLIAREVVPFVLSVLVRDAFNKLKRKMTEKKGPVDKA